MKGKRKTTLGEPRFYVVVSLVLLLAAGLALRAAYLQVYDREFLKGQGDARAVRMERINAHRGIIQDRHGKPLAVSTPVLSLWSEPGQTLTVKDLSPLAAFLNVPESEIRARLETLKDRKFVYLRRHLPPADARQLLDQGLSGIHAAREYRRFYPAGEVTSHLLGFTNIDDEGQEGLELAYNHWLAGEPGRKRVLKNLHGELIRDGNPIKQAVSGRSLSLTIDLRLQYLAYRELKSAVAHFNAEAGSLILLDVATGQLLAMVNQPAFNPNNRAQLDMAALRNRALTDGFEPGSTVKPFTVAAALLTGRYDSSSLIDTAPGFLRVDGFTIRDPSNLGVLSLRQVLTHSSQVGISRLALGLDEYEIRSLFESLDFGRESSLGFPGEEEGYLPNHRRWSDIDRVALAYGYGLKVTPLQLASAYQALAAGGIKHEVSLIIGDKPSAKRVLSREVAGQIRSMLADVVLEGTGKKAAIDGYSVGGKTGTARKLGKEGYQDTRHLAFFAGMAPLSAPRLVGVVLIDAPNVEASGGGATAAPVFSRVMRDALRILNVIPEEHQASSIENASKAVEETASKANEDGLT